jgi:hypothetical protein
VPTTSGRLYYKAAPAAFAHEPRLTHALTEWRPRHFPEVLALDGVRNGILMKEFDGTPLERISDLARWEAALRLFAGIQIDGAAHVDDLLALGCPDRRMGRLAEQIEPFLAGLPSPLSDLSAAETETLHSLVPRLEAACAVLAECGVPETLEHGDFWAGNVIATDTGYRFFDWSDSSVSHPFFSMLYFLDGIEDRFPDIPDARVRLRDAYLESWTTFAPMERLTAAFERAQPLAAIHNALTYHAILLPQMEARWEMENMVPFYLKMLLRKPH